MNRCADCKRRLWLSAVRCGECRHKALIGSAFPCAGPKFDTSIEAYRHMTDRRVKETGRLIETPAIYRCIDGHHHYSYEVERNPEAFGRRIIRLRNERGVRDALAQSLWNSGNEALVAQLENATDLEISELNTAWEQRGGSAAVAVPLRMLRVDLGDRDDGIRRVELHPTISQKHVAPVVGSQLTVTYQVTRVDKEQPS